MSAARLSIGEALARLRAEFPDEEIKESKIRFLESEGLIEPERTASRYRKYSERDMDRLRYILRAQKDHYLPLRVIKEQLDAMDAGREVPGPMSGPMSGPISGPMSGPVSAATQPRSVVAADGLPTAESFGGSHGDDRISRRELLKTAGIDDALLTQLEDFGLVKPRLGSGHYDGDAVLIAKTAGELAGYGIEPRHLRGFRTAADRELGLVEQVVAPVRRSREQGAESRAAETGQEIAALAVRLHAGLVKVGLRNLR